MVFVGLIDPLLFYHKKLVIYRVNMNNKGSWMIIFIHLFIILMMKWYDMIWSDLLLNEWYEMI